MKKLLSGLSLALAAAWIGSAAAQPSSSQPAPAPAPAALPDVDLGVLEDANSDRTWMSPTALVAPAGTWSFHDHELLLVGVGYSVTNSVALSLTTMIPLTRDMPLILFATGKAQIARAGRFRLAGHAMISYLGADDGFSTAIVGGAGTYCLDDDCHSILNAYVGAGFALSSLDQTSTPLALTVAWVQRLSNRMKLVLELDSAAILGEINDIANGFLGWYGLRFTSRNIAVDLGFVKPICEGCSSDVLPMGFPWLNFTYRGI